MCTFWLSFHCHAIIANLLCRGVLLADGGIWYNRIQDFHTASHVDLKHLLG